MSRSQKEVKKMKVTSMKIEPLLWREIRIRSIQEGRDTQDIVAEALRDYLKKTKKGARNG